MRLDNVMLAEMLGRKVAQRTQPDLGTGDAACAGRVARSSIRRTTSRTSAVSCMSTFPFCLQYRRNFADDVLSHIPDSFGNY